MVSLDLITCHAAAHSYDIQRGFIAQGIKPYTSSTSVASAVKRYAALVKKEIKDFLLKKKIEGHRFSTTTDEWTDMNVRRFACFNVHLPGGEPRTIGMVRITDTLDAENAADILTKKLEEYDLSVSDDISSTTTDGASVMVAMGKLLPCEHIQCMSHGLHLAICDCLYKKKDASSEGEGSLFVPIQKYFCQKYL